MRVISGASRGFRLTAPSGRETRPTSDRVKEALFSVLESYGAIQDTRVLDIFSGSGALAIEALSRGASDATMIEKSRNATETIRKNLKHTGMEARTTLLSGDFSQMLALLARKKESFNLVIIDPPYAAGFHQKAIELSCGLMTQDAILVAETASRDELPERILSLHRFTRKIYGDTALDFYRKDGDICLTAE